MLCANTVLERISERFKVISGKRMCRLLEERGWQLDRIKGSHHVYRHLGTGQSVTVPVHGNKTLKTGIQHAIMKAAGVPKPGERRIDEQPPEEQPEEEQP